MSHDDHSELVRERAALYALGALADDEARAVEARLAAGDPEYVAAVASFRSVVTDLAHAAAPRAPRPQARARLLESIATLEAPVLEDGGLRFVRGGRLDWVPGASDGLDLKLLRVDEASRRATLLARLAPGASYPHHRHRDVEEIFLLEGDLEVNGVPMRAGDYCSAAPHTEHDGVRSAGGCVFLVTASLDDERLA